MEAETIGRVALVTGGARRIGAAIVRALAARGHAVIIHCHAARDDAEALAAAIRADGGRAAVVAADLADPAAVAGLIGRAAEAFGPLTLLVNNASVFLADTLHTIDVPTWNRQFSVNIRAPSVLAKDFAAQVPAGAPASIVNIVDQRVAKLTPQFYSYTLSKAALAAATVTMAQTLAPAIRVNGVSPGPVLPNPHEGGNGFDREAAGIPLGRAVAPAEIAAAVAYLAEATSVTGQILAVDGGQQIGWRTPDIVE
jgi:NAD(P)-dependent dehydrogenase (short-subunit alcohol dehydrogenase family)